MDDVPNFEAMIAAVVANALPNLTAALRTQITNDIRNGAESSGGSGGGGDATPQGFMFGFENSFVAFKLEGGSTELVESSFAYSVSRDATEQARPYQVEDRGYDSRRQDFRGQDQRFNGRYGNDRQGQGNYNQRQHRGQSTRNFNQGHASRLSNQRRSTETLPVLYLLVLIGKPHPGVCYKATGGCFTCGSTQHKVKDCPQAKQKQNMPTDFARLPPTTGRVYATTRDQAAKTSGTITGNLYIDDRTVFVLFDTGATHSIISTTFAKKLNMNPTPLIERVIISTPMKNHMLIDHEYVNCPLRFADRIRPANLLPIHMLDFDVILGMDWLASHRATIDCYARTVIFGNVSQPGNVFIMVSADGIIMDPSKVEAITKWPRPTTVEKYCVDNERSESFEGIETRLVSAPILTLLHRFPVVYIQNIQRWHRRKYLGCVSMRTWGGLLGEYEDKSLTSATIKEAQRRDMVSLWAIVQNVEDCKHTEHDVASKVRRKLKVLTFTIHPVQQTKMYRDLKQYFWWNGMKQDVANFCIHVITESLGTRLKVHTAFHPKQMVSQRVTIQIPLGRYVERLVALEWTGSLDEYLCLVGVLPNNNSWHASIKSAPCRSLYGRKCRAPICLLKVRFETVRDQGQAHPLFIGPIENFGTRIGEVSYSFWRFPLRSYRTFTMSFHVSLVEGYHYHRHCLSHLSLLLKFNLICLCPRNPESILDLKMRVKRNKVYSFCEGFFGRITQSVSATWERPKNRIAELVYPHFFV
ncbi:reverse transcriptase domain-containing protein [Tanacetum coccineum]